MKQLNANNVAQVSVDEETLKKQIKVGQTISKINTLMDVAEGMNTQEWDGVQKLPILIQIENKLITLIDDL
tara:strand:+ start:1911 stop:2123 length:213 start_codon:yes stop_codon:yes gene_type:complete